MRHLAGWLSNQVNRFVEIVLILLMAALVIDVWIGVIDRYIFRWQFNWPEPLARFLMIWTVMLAISSGIARRQHIGLTIVIDYLPRALRRGCLILADLLALGLFAYLFWYGWGFAAGGATRQAMIFGMSLGPIYSAIPVAAALACVQLVLVLIRDLGEHKVEAQSGKV